MAKMGIAVAVVFLVAYTGMYMLATSPLVIRVVGGWFGG